MHQSVRKVHILCAVLALFALGSISSPHIGADESQSAARAAEDENAFPKPEYGRDLPMAFAQGMAANLAIWGYDYMIMQPYARVSPTTWKNNIEEGPEWDNSDFFTNQILHPYHGSMYYTGARAYGFSYWESLAFAELGSYIWEYYAERDTPAINDLIVTAVGGAAFGEAGYRIAIAFSDSNTAGGARGFFREFAAWVVNPMYMLNKWVFGEPFAERNKLPRTHLDFIVRGGLNYTHDDDERFSDFPHAYLGALIRYGSPWDSGSLYGPYDYFSVKVDGEVDYVNPSWDIFADAILCGFKLYIGKQARAVLGLYQQFDYLENLVYKLASNGAGPGFDLRLPFGERSSVELNSYFYGMILGVMDSRYSHWEIDNYDTKGTGWSYKAGLKYLCEGYFSLSLNYFYYRMWVLDGADWTNTVHIFTSTLEAYTAPDTSIGLELRYYQRWSDAGYDNAWAWSLKTYIAYKL
ncbi:MAG: DUF3943 domain-containing protein [Spirochaetales bacterium]|jgi:hypothetical protein|nr:DUF3943 domain-containing protein [Spirochaetales bacterium]